MPTAAANPVLAPTPDAADPTLPTRRGSHSRPGTFTHFLAHPGQRRSVRSPNVGALVRGTCCLSAGPFSPPAAPAARLAHQQPARNSPVPGGKTQANSPHMPFARQRKSLPLRQPLLERVFLPLCSRLSRLAAARLGSLLSVPPARRRKEAAYPEFLFPSMHETCASQLPTGAGKRK